MYSSKIFSSIQSILDKKCDFYRANTLNGTLILPSQNVGSALGPITFCIVVEKENFSIISYPDNIAVLNKEQIAEFLMRINARLKFDKFIVKYDNLSIQGMVCIRTGDRYISEGEFIYEIERISAVYEVIGEGVLNLLLEIQTPEDAAQEAISKYFTN